MIERPININMEAPAAADLVRLFHIEKLLNQGSFTFYMSDSASIFLSN